MTKVDRDIHSQRILDVVEEAGKSITYKEAVLKIKEIEKKRSEK